MCKFNDGPCLSQLALAACKHGGRAATHNAKLAATAVHRDTVDCRSRWLPEVPIHLTGRRRNVPADQDDTRGGGRVQPGSELKLKVSDLMYSSLGVQFD